MARGLVSLRIQELYIWARMLIQGTERVPPSQSLVACLAHELSHVERFERGYRRPIEMPEMLIDEAETSLNASFMQLISQRDREDLIDAPAARDRLIQWLAMTNSQGGEK